MNIKKKIGAAFIYLLCLLNFGNFSYAQVKDSNSKPKTTSSALSKAQADIDSLNIVISQVKASYENAVRINKGKDSLVDEMDAKILNMQNINNDLERKLSTYKGDNLKLDQSNRILIIFNAIVGVLLLTTLIWFLRNIGRKKAPDKTKTVSVIETAAPSNRKTPAPTNDNEYFDTKLEQLEKLGVLRDKGILNEEEFNRQKQQILGNT
jgi:putative oligomerization/nucleic acid binding protein